MYYLKQTLFEECLEVDMDYKTRLYRKLNDPKVLCFRFLWWLTVRLPIFADNEDVSGSTPLTTTFFVFFNKV